MDDQNADNKYGKWLRDSRKQAKLTQKELAEKVNVVRGYISNLELGIQKNITGKYTRIDLDKCDRISIALGKPILEGRAAAGYIPEASENFQAIAFDVETWSEANRIEAFSKMEKIYNQFKEKESKEKSRFNHRSLQAEIP